MYIVLAKVHVALVEFGWMEPDEANPLNPLGKPFDALIPRTNVHGLWSQVIRALYKPEHRFFELDAKIRAKNEALVAALAQK